MAETENADFKNDSDRSVEENTETGKRERRCEMCDAGPEKALDATHAIGRDLKL